MKTIRIGTRTSALALKQTEMVMQAIKERYKDVTFEVVPMKTKGDKLLQAALIEFGGKGAFVSEFEEALLDGTIDIAVHSAKDMPMELAEGLGLWMVLKRADARDVLVTRKEENPKPEQPMVIGTSSLRRELQIGQLLPSQCKLLRGNVPTRIEKLQEGLYDGIILAAAGLERLELNQEENLCYRYLSYDEMIPAGGQGIIAVEGREKDDLRKLFEECSDRKAEMELETERFMLEKLEAGCHEPIGVFSEIEGEDISIRLLLENNGNAYKGKRNGKVSERFSLAEELIKEVRKYAGK